MRIRFSPESVGDLKRLHDFICAHDPAVARSAVANLQSAVTRLAGQPRMGHPVEDMEGVREFVFGRYVVRYTVRGAGRSEALYVLRVWNARGDR